MHFPLLTITKYRNDYPFEVALGTMVLVLHGKGLYGRLWCLPRDWSKPIPLAIFHSSIFPVCLRIRGIDLAAIVSDDTGQPTIRYNHVAYDEANHSLLPIA